MTSGNVLGIISMRWADELGFVAGQNYCPTDGSNGLSCTNKTVEGFQYQHRIEGTQISMGIQGTNNGGAFLFSIHWGKDPVVSKKTQTYIHDDY